MRRGEIWEIKTSLATRRVLVVQSDAVTELHPGVLVVPLHQQGEVRQTLVTVPVAGYVANCCDVGRVMKARFRAQVATASPEEIEQVEIGLRAVMEL